MLPILYSFRRCPYAMRARMALLASGVRCELREISLKQKPAEMLAISPKASVPVLQLPNGEVIDESFDIMHWALRQNDPDQWLDAYSADLIAQNDGDFKYHLDRYKYPNRFNSNSHVHRAAGFAFLETLEILLCKNDFLCADTPKLADFALMPFVRQFAQTDRAWFDMQPAPLLQNWLDAMAESPLFARAMRVYDLWTPGNMQEVLH
jgi:glutathione S-transferase